MKLLLTLALPVLLLLGCSNENDNNESSSVEDIKLDKAPSISEENKPEAIKVDVLTQLTVNTDSAYIPPQCYTEVKDESGVHNPCYACHVNGTRPNYLHDDGELPLSYDFTGYSSTNRYANLFKDRTDLVAKISDLEIDQYVSEDNYKEDDGSIILTEKLNNLPKDWDSNKDGIWDGFKPDAYFHFDNEGFDINPSGQPTGWVAFAYYPFLGAFWPTNGSTDDVLIRLPESFRNNTQGKFDKEVYKINLAVVESVIREKDINIPQIDETQYDVDLNRDGQLSTADKVVYQWQPLSDVHMSYVGQAKDEYTTKTTEMAAGLYPKGTEFLHSVRYLSIDNGQVSISKRMKELRYSVKETWNNYSQLSNAVSGEIKERHDFPDRLATYSTSRKSGMEKGLYNGRGWRYQGFIEDSNGDLRPQSYEETLFCMGCHTGVGATTDASFAFPRKFDLNTFQQGYYHWSQKGFDGVKDPARHDGKLEYTYYLENNRSGNEFRTNDEVETKFFSNGALKPEMAEKLKNDISELLVPSVERARKLNKAYKVIVDEQSYIYGRDAHIKPLDAVVKKTIPIGEDTGIETAISAPKL